MSEKASAATVSGNTGGKQQTVIRSIASDIRFIKPDKRILRNSTEASYPSPLLLLLYIVPAGVFVLSCAVKKHQINPETIEHKRKKATLKQARKSLDTASDMLENGNVKDFYGLIRDCVIRYLENVMDIETGALNTVTMESDIIQYGVPEKLAGHIGHIIDTCDSMEFAPDMTETQDHTCILDKTREVLEEIEKMLIVPTMIRK